MNLSQKKILITGGTSRLGSVFVQKALAQGAYVYMTFCHNKEEAEKLKQLGAQTFELDLADVRAIETFAKKLKEETKSMDIVIHNAAAIRDHTIKNLTVEDWDYVLDVNLKAPYYLSKQLIPFLFRSKETKKIFMLTSRAAVQSGFGISNYAAAKAGLIGLVKSLAQELGKKKILVNAINPGFMMSGMTKDLPKEVLEKNRMLSPLHEFSEPEQVADFLIHLCSDHMKQVSGQVFHYESRSIS